jgi:hypothetical protein
METDSVFKMMYHILVLMDTSKTAMENVFSHQQHAVLDMKVLEMEIVSQYK